MGLTNDRLEDFDKEVKDEDLKTNDEDCIDGSKVQKLKELEDELDDLKKEYEEQFISASMALSDKKRLQYLRLNKESKAEEEANKAYTFKTKKRNKNNCAAPFCLIYPIYEEAKCDRKIECNECKASVHIRCEGQVQYNENYQTIPDGFKCTKCEGGGVEDQVEKIKQAQETIDTDSAATERDITETEGKIKHLEKKMTEDLGPRQKILKQSFAKLGISTSQYFAKSFGGSLEGNQVQKVLDDAEKGDFIILEALKDKPEVIEKYKEAFKCLSNVDKKLKVKNNNMTDEEVLEIKKECEKWGEIMPHMFGHKNITPKGHWLIFVIPKFIKRNRTFHMYYRCEQGCEKIHALLNKIESNLLNVRNKHERHRIMIAR